jgi:transposase
MNFYTTKHEYSCGIDLHGKTMYLCVLDREGKKVLHRNIRNDTEYLARILEPYKSDLVVSSECIFNWYWLSDFCEEQGFSFVLGHALYMKAIHGGKAKNDKIDSEKIARMLHGGMLPAAYVYPKEKRATRDLMRRRTYFARKKAELLGHIQLTRIQYNLPEFGVNLTHKCHREGIAGKFSDSPVQLSVESDFRIITEYDKLLRELEQSIEKSAKHHSPNEYGLLRSIPGVGPVLGLTLLYEIDTIKRFESVGKFLSYARLVKCQKESSGKSLGTSGAKIGNAHLKWAFSEATLLFLKDPEAKKYFQKLERKHPKGKALSILAAKLGKSVYQILTNKEFFDMKKFSR